MKLNLYRKVMANFHVIMYVALVLLLITAFNYTVTMNEAILIVTKMAGLVLVILPWVRVIGFVLETLIEEEKENRHSEATNKIARA